VGSPPLGAPYVSPLPSGGLNVKKGGAMFSINFSGNFRVLKQHPFLVKKDDGKKFFRKISIVKM